MMRHIIHPLLLIAALGLTACLQSEPKFKVGQCINPVDGSQIYKLTQVDGKKMQGRLFESQRYANEAVTVPDRMYVEVPCPRSPST